MMGAQSVDQSSQVDLYFNHQGSKRTLGDVSVFQNKLFQTVRFSFFLSLSLKTEEPVVSYQVSRPPEPQEDISSRHWRPEVVITHTAQ